MLVGPRRFESYHLFTPLCNQWPKKEVLNPMPAELAAALLAAVGKDPTSAGVLGSRSVHFQAWVNSG